MSTRPRTLAILALALAPALVAAQTVYHCPSGYSQEPCPAGTPVEVSDPRSADQQQQSRQAAKRDAQLADWMAKERLQREAQTAAYLPPPHLAAAAQEQAALARKKDTKPKVFTATVPGSGKQDKRSSTPVRKERRAAGSSAKP